MIDFSIVKSLFGKQIQDLLNSLGGDANQVFSNKILEYIVEEYNRNTYTKTLLHRTNPVKLLDIFVPTNLLTKRRRRFFEKEEEFELTELSTIFLDKQYITVIGDAGSGKSTLVKYLYLQCVKDSFEKIPVKIELRYLNDQALSVKEYIIDKLLIETGIAVNERIAIRMLQKGKMIFFFDGYDEIDKSSRARYTNQLNEFMRDFNNNYYLLTSRPFTGAEFFPLCRNYYIVGFGKDQMKDFVEKQLMNYDQEIAPSIKQEIDNLYDTDFHSFLSNPLLLSMFVLTYRHNPVIPEQKHLFYQQVFDALFFEHDSLLKLGYQRKKNSHLDKVSFENVLMLFSFLTLFEEQFYFSKEYLVKLLLKVKSKLKIEDLDIEGIIEDLLVSVPIFYKEGLYFSYAHKSLQEFFAAKFVSRLPIDKKQKFYKKIIDGHYLGWFKMFVAEVTKKSSLENFCLLLKEYNEEEYSKLFVIPLLTEVRNYLASKQKNTEEKKNLIVRDTYQFLIKFELLGILELERVSKTTESLDSIEAEYLLSYEQEEKRFNDKVRENPQVQSDLNFLRSHEDQINRIINRYSDKVTTIIIDDIDLAIEGYNVVMNKMSRDLDDLIDEVF